MYNDPEVSAELHRLAEAEPLPEFDTNAVLTRGHRGLLRRRLLGAGGAVAGVAAIALAATLLPTISSAKQDPGVAGTENSQFEAVPGVPRGEDGAGQRIDKAEAKRRCALRYPGATGDLVAKELRSVRTLMYDFRPTSADKGGRSVTISPDGKKAGPLFSCTVPGGDKPSAALVAAAEADPLPKTTAGQLRNCSVAAWTDMTKWNVVAAERLDTSNLKNYRGFSRAQLVAVSPSGRTAIACELPQRDMPPSGFGWGVFALKLDDLGTDTPHMEWPDGTIGKDIATIIGEGTDCEGTVCGKSIPTGWGRTSVDAAKIVVQIGTGPKFDVPVKDGWFAFAKFDQQSHNDKTDHLTVRAYDKDGKLLSKIYPER